MGMYDYLGGEQIKIFYRPIFDRNKEEPSQSSFWHSGGSLASYDKGEELPLKTIYYQYPNDFMVYDYRWDYTDVWVIRNGQFEKLVPFMELTEEEMNVPVFDYYGNPLTIQSLVDFQLIKEDFKERFEALTAVEKEFFPEGIRKSFKDDPESFEAKSQAWQKRQEEVSEKYAGKWVVEKDHAKEREFGGLLDCYVYLLLRKEEKPIASIDPRQDYEACRLTLQRIMKETPDIVDRFKAWVNDDEMIKQNVVDELIAELNGTGENYQVEYFFSEGQTVRILKSLDVNTHEVRHLLGQVGKVARRYFNYRTGEVWYDVEFSTKEVEPFQEFELDSRYRKRMKAVTI